MQRSKNSKTTTIEDCTLIDLPRVNNRSGNITPIEERKEIPFPIKRIFYIYDIPGGEARGAHAHKQCHQFIVAASGAFEIVVSDSKEIRTVMLNRPFKGLHIPPGIWASEQEFSSGAICLVLTSHEYDESDYIRNYSEFQRLKQI